MAGYNSGEFMDVVPPLGLANGISSLFGVVSISDIIRKHEPSRYYGSESELASTCPQAVRAQFKCTIG